MKFKNKNDKKCIDTAENGIIYTSTYVDNIPGKYYDL